MKAILFFAVTALVLAVVTINAPAQDWGCGGPCSTLDTLGMSDPAWAPSYNPPPVENRYSLQNPDFGYQEPAFEYGSDFSDHYEDQERSEQSQWRLQNLYQNQKPAACGPAFDPRAREGC
ncbi:MAG: hypothetical protein OXI53_11355 [Nitrospira sp.]|nr:hypothetical protein [Nitrospira sp.]MDE0505167.1 hypothetical protein [Candidatus Poribacteria bacterium]